MRVPDSLMALLDDGIVEEVVRPLMSGKEAQIYVVVSEGQTRVAKIYKESEQRNFKNRADYTEGRKVRNSRDARAMAKRSKHGKAQDEAAWRSTEVDMIYRLRQIGVRVPEPYHFIDGVLIMEMVSDGSGMPAPRLGEMSFTVAQAHRLFGKLLKEVQRMLCAGVVHGDLSDFNVLMAEDGPVVIDFPQSVHAANNRNARKLLLRDVANLDRFVQRFDPAWRAKSYAEEMWSLYENGDLTAHTVLTGRYAAPTHAAATGEVFALIEDAREEALRRQNRPDGPSPRRSGGPKSQPKGQARGQNAPRQGGGGAQGSRTGGRGGAKTPIVTYAGSPRGTSVSQRPGSSRQHAMPPPVDPRPMRQDPDGEGRAKPQQAPEGGTAPGQARRRNRRRRPPRRP